MRTTKILAVLVGCAIAWAGLATSAAAQCVSVAPVLVPDVRIDLLDASGAAQVMQPLTLTFRRNGPEGEVLHVTYQILDEDSSVQRVGVTAGPQVEWRSGNSDRIIGVTRNETFALLRSGEVDLHKNDSSADAAVRLFVKNLGDDLPAGVYREGFTVRYWCGDAESTTAEESPGAVTVTVQIPNVISANVAGVSGTGEIDFLDFETLTRTLAVSVRSTGRYEISARSVNGGAMLRDGEATSEPASRISYQVSFAGQTLPLGDGTSFVRPRAGLGGEQIPLEVVVEDVSAKRAGEYRDTLVLTLSPVT